MARVELEAVLILHSDKSLSVELRERPDFRKVGNVDKKPWKMTPIELQVASLIGELEQQDVNERARGKLEGSVARATRHKKHYAKMIKVIGEDLLHENQCLHEILFATGLSVKEIEQRVAELEKQARVSEAKKKKGG